MAILAAYDHGIHAITLDHPALRELDEIAALIDWKAH